MCAPKCMYVHPLHGGTQKGQKKATDPLEVELWSWGIIRTWGAKPSSSARTVRALNHWASSPAPWWFNFLFLLQFPPQSLPLLSNLNTGTHHGPGMPLPVHLSSIFSRYQILPYTLELPVWLVLRTFSLTDRGTLSVICGTQAVPPGNEHPGRILIQLRARS